VYRLNNNQSYAERKKWVYLIKQRSECNKRNQNWTMLRWSQMMGFLVTLYWNGGLNHTCCINRCVEHSSSCKLKNFFSNRVDKTRVKIVSGCEILLKLGFHHGSLTIVNFYFTKVYLLIWWKLERGIKRNPALLSFNRSLINTTYLKNKRFH